MVFQANRYYGAPQQAHNEQEVARHGDIKPDASGLTKFWRGVKNAPSGPLNMIRNLVSTAAVVAPIPSLGKISGVMNFLKSTPMQVIRKNSDFLKSTPMQAIRSAVKGKTPTSKPVNFKGPNPAHKTGAGGNSYSHPAAVTFRETGKTPTTVYRETGKFTTGDFHKLGN